MNKCDDAVTHRFSDCGRVEGEARRERREYVRKEETGTYRSSENNRKSQTKLMEAGKVLKSKLSLF